MPDPQGHHILLVEDEPDVASFVRQGLEEEGYEVSWVETGQRGLEYAQQGGLGLVLLDIRLPDLSGLEVCERLRLHRPDLPVLMLTALDAVEDRVWGLRAGADDYLPKPFAFDELIARIEALLRRVQRIVAEHDGQLQIDTTPGEGTRVTAALPAAPQPTSPRVSDDKRPGAPAN